MAENIDFSRRNTILKRLDSELTALIVLIYGLLIISLTLVEFIGFRHFGRLTDISIDIPLFIGISFIYLSSMLRRLKKTAWGASLLIFTFYLGANLEGISDRHQLHETVPLEMILRLIVLPLLILILLLINYKRYTVRSDIRSFRSAIILSIVVLSITFVYGTIGFLYLGSRDFHQSLSIPAAMHYTLDQFNVTTNHAIHAYTKKAKLFQDSLGVISTLAVIYVLLSLFQPLRSRFGDQSAARNYFRLLLSKQHDAKSEDFFKLWPLDKQYFFDSTRSSAVSFSVYRRTAVILGGPCGKRARFRQLLVEFQYVCFGNDWRPAIIHCEDTDRELYESMGYSMQKIGQEAVVNLEHFHKEVISNKYFRNINNRFKKAGYTFELLSPPHNPLVMSRLKAISDEWLSHGNRSERGFALGYFQEEYLNNCKIGIAKNDSGVIEAFINVVPAEWDEMEATYDLLRYAQSSLPNTNDFLLISVSRELELSGYVSINLGLCPLSGLGEESEDKPNGLIDYFLSFAYHNGDRIYSFSGLYRFKNKYEPEWQDSYVAYQGGVTGFSRTMNAVMALMRLGAKHPSKKFL